MSIERLSTIYDHLKAAKMVEDKGDFAKKLGYKSRTYVSEVLNGRKPITDDFEDKLSSVFNINTTWLREGVGEMYITAADKTKSLAKGVEAERAGHKDTYRLNAYLKHDKIERLESKWKSLLAGLMLGKQETKTMQELDDIIQDLKVDNDRLEDEQKRRNNEADTK